MLFYFVFYGFMKVIGNFIFLDKKEKKLKKFYEIKKN